jgi:pyridoxamine 5'-phosphate oxidase-like protein
VAQVVEEITPELREFVEAQPVFFVATAPRADDGHVNVSPKGLDTFRVLGPHSVAYLDLTGSGAETIAHLRENGRITLMFCAFTGRPNIVRLYGRGRVVQVGTDEAEPLLECFPDIPGARSVIVVDVTRVSTSCGYAVPLMQEVGPRRALVDWAEKRGDDGLTEYRATKNTTSIDGLPGWS